MATVRTAATMNMAFPRINHDAPVTWREPRLWSDYLRPPEGVEPAAGRMVPGEAFAAAFGRLPWRIRAWRALRRFLVGPRRAAG